MELRGTDVAANLVSPGMIATDEVRAMVTRRAERDGSAASWLEAERWALDNSMPNLTGADIAIDGGARDA